MTLLVRAACAAVAAAALLLAPATSRAELVPGKLKYALLVDRSESVVTEVGSETGVFFELFALKGKPGCVLVRYSGELTGTDLDASGHVSATFKVYIGEAEVQPYPAMHEALTSVLPQIVSFSAFACGVPAGDSGVLVTMRPSDGDVVSTVYRNLEIWTERPVLSTPVSGPFVAPATGQAPPNLLKVKRSFVAASEDAVITTGDEPAALFHESVVLKGSTGCILVRFSGEVQTTDVDANGIVGIRFAVGIGLELPNHPNLHDTRASGQAQNLTFSAFRCGLPPGPYDVDVSMEAGGDQDEVAVRKRVLEVFTQSGVAVPAAP